MQKRRHFNNKSQIIAILLSGITKRLFLIGKQSKYWHKHMRRDALPISYWLTTSYAYGDDDDDDDGDDDGDDDNDDKECSIGG